MCWASMASLWHTIRPAIACQRGRMVRIAAVPPLLDALDANYTRISDALCDAKLKLAGESVG